MGSEKVVVVIDWKKFHSFVGVEFALQISRYARCPYLYDKVEQQQTLMPPVEYGVVCWVGAEGVQAKMILNAAELTEGAEMHRQASRLAVYAAKFDSKPFVPSRYPHPFKPDVQLMSVTETNKRVMAKDGLLSWYHKKGVEGVLTLLREYGSELPPLAEMPLDYVLSALESHKLRPTDLRDQAGEQGRLYHKLAMFYLQGKPVDLTDAPTAHKDMVAKFAAWCTKVKLEPLAVEQMVYEEEPNPIAGTLDALATVDRAWVESEWTRLHNQEGNNGR